MAKKSQVRIDALKDFDDYVIKANERERKQLDAQRDCYFGIVLFVEREVKKHPVVFEYELRMLESMKIYLNKFKWLPDSYRDLLKDYYAIAKEWDKIPTRVKFLDREIA
jgi:hypothetical protein